MAITVTPDMTDISLCEVVGNWSTGSVNDIFFKQGLGSMGLKVSETESALITWDFAAPVDMSGGKHIYFWTMITGMPDTKTNDGIRLYVETDGNNYGYFNVGGSDNYPGGWVCWCLDPGATPTSGLGTINAASVAKVGVRFNITSKAVGNNPNCFWDAVRYGTGLEITSGPADGIDFEDIFAEDDATANCYGVISKINNVYFLQGKLYFGDAAAGDIDFKDVSQLVVFKDNEFVDAAFYEIVVQGNGAGTTNFQYGNKSGSSGIEGCVLKSAGTKTFKFTATDTDIDVFKLYGSTFINAGVVSLPPNAAGREVLNCIFIASAEVLPDTCLVQYCDFISADSQACRMTSTSPTPPMKDCRFIGCPFGVHISVADTYTFDHLTFSGCTKDIDNTSGGAVIVNAINLADPATYTGDTTINNTKTLLVTTKNAVGIVVSSANVRIEKDPSGDLISEGVTDVNGEYTDTAYNYLGDQDVKVVARKKGYDNNQAYDTIKSTGLSVPFTMIRDGEVNMP